MHELVPVVIGVVIGMLAGPSPSRRAVALAAAASVVLGVAVAAVTGELGRSAGYALFDAGVIACTAVPVVAAQRLARRARAQREIREARDG